MVTDLILAINDNVTAGNPLGILANYADLGVIVLFFGLFYAGKFRREAEVKERDEEIAELKAALKEYTRHYQEDVLPALIEVTKVSGEVVAYLNKRRN